MIGSLCQFFPRVPAMTAVQYLAEGDELRPGVRSAEGGAVTKVIGISTLPAERPV